MEAWESLAYRRLASAVVVEACNDYIRNVSKLKNTKDTSVINRCQNTIKECLDFFYSYKFRLFAQYDGEISDLLDRLDFLAKNKKLIIYSINDKNEEMSDESYVG